MIEHLKKIACEIPSEWGLNFLPQCGEERQHPAWSPPIKFLSIVLGPSSPGNPGEQWLAWFRDRGCVAKINQDSELWLFPIVDFPINEKVYHVCPSENLSRIQKFGLTTGRLAGKSTTKWSGALDYIHVFANAAYCEDFVRLDCKIENINFRTWVVLEVDVLAARINVAHDPESGQKRAGLLLTEWVEPRFLSEYKQLEVS